MIGGVLAAAGIAALVNTPVATAAMLFPFWRWSPSPCAGSASACRWRRSRRSSCCCPNWASRAASEFAIAAWRATFTLAGGVLAVLGGVLLWPSWEPARVRADMRKAIEAHGRLCRCGTGSLARGSGTAAQAEAARRDAGVASNTLETSLSRALQEPKPSARPELRAAMVADAALRRVAGRLAAVQHAPNLTASLDLPAWRIWLARAFAALAAGDPLPAGRPPDAQTGSLARIARQIALIDGALRPAEAAQPAAPSRQPPP